MPLRGCQTCENRPATHPIVARVFVSTFGLKTLFEEVTLTEHGINKVVYEVLNVKEMFLNVITYIPTSYRVKSDLCYFKIIKRTIK